MILELLCGNKASDVFLFSDILSWNHILNFYHIQDTYAKITSHWKKYSSKAVL